MTQNARVLRQLRLGPVNMADFQLPGVCDGGKPIARLAARILDLQKLGYEIASERAANGTSIYWLISEPATTTSGTPSSPPAAADVDGSAPPAPVDTLFDTAQLAPRGSYRDQEAA